MITFLITVSQVVGIVIAALIGSVIVWSLLAHDDAPQVDEDRMDCFGE